ncbi:hypothetical protein [Turneriella parva]|uniref:Uncharacterized protein n=1 Tax=Turneriella parva (strain ATCC BAA-1111 / DSM 21527 / NCTC 11395 / H) TaxID=869212 RepID=I4BAA8_TURPD|nr:hypothetical protein [Turneriella parva]AFM14215.1 hypothetical protein Turpa_3581 [Turneriella parva DSM 21527]
MPTPEQIRKYEADMIKYQNDMARYHELQEEWDSLSPEEKEYADFEAEMGQIFWFSSISVGLIATSGLLYLKLHWALSLLLGIGAGLGLTSLMKQTKLFFFTGRFFRATFYGFLLNATWWLFQLIFSSLKIKSNTTAWIVVGILYALAFAAELLGITKASAAPKKPSEPAKPI